MPFESVFKVINGDINLETGEFTPKRNYCNIKTEFKGLDYDISLIESYIDELVGKENSIKLRNLLGNLLMKRPFNPILNLYGYPYSGKSTFINLLCELLGKDIIKSPAAIITEDIYETRGKETKCKVVVVDNVTEDCDIKLNLLKRFISEDKVTHLTTYGEEEKASLGNLIVVSTENIVTNLQKNNDFSRLKYIINPIEFRGKFYINEWKFKDMAPYLDQLLVWIVKGAIKNHQLKAGICGYHN